MPCCKVGILRIDGRFVFALFYITSSLVLHSGTVDVHLLQIDNCFEYLDVIPKRAAALAVFRNVWMILRNAFGY